MEVATASTPTPAPTTDPTATTDPSGAGKAKKPYPWMKNPWRKNQNKRIHLQKRGAKNHLLRIL